MKKIIEGLNSQDQEFKEDCLRCVTNAAAEPRHRMALIGGGVVDSIGPMVDAGESEPVINMLGIWALSNLSLAGEEAQTIIAESPGLLERLVQIIDESDNHDIVEKGLWLLTNLTIDHPENRAALGAMQIVPMLARFLKFRSGGSGESLRQLESLTDESLDYTPEILCNSANPLRNLFFDPNNQLEYFGDEGAASQVAGELVSLLCSESERVVEAILQIILMCTAFHQDIRDTFLHSTHLLDILTKLLRRAMKNRLPFVHVISKIFVNLTMADPGPEDEPAPSLGGVDSSVSSPRSIVEPSMFIKSHSFNLMMDILRKKRFSMDVKGDVVTYLLNISTLPMALDEIRHADGIRLLFDLIRMATKLNDTNIGGGGDDDDEAKSNASKDFPNSSKDLVDSSKDLVDSSKEHLEPMFLIDMVALLANLSSRSKNRSIMKELGAVDRLKKLTEYLEAAKEGPLFEDDPESFEICMENMSICLENLELPDEADDESQESASDATSGLDGDEASHSHGTDLTSSDVHPTAAGSAAAGRITSAAAEAVLSGALEVPAGWEVRESKSRPGAFYFAHLVSGRSEWDLPLGEDGQLQEPESDDVEAEAEGDTDEPPHSRSPLASSAVISTQMAAGTRRRSSTSVESRPSNLTQSMSIPIHSIDAEEGSLKGPGTTTPPLSSRTGGSGKKKRTKGSTKLSASTTVLPEISEETKQAAAERRLRRKKEKEAAGGTSARKRAPKSAEEIKSRSERLKEEGRGLERSLTPSTPRSAPKDETLVKALDPDGRKTLLRKVKSDRKNLYMSIRGQDDRKVQKREQVVNELLQSEETYVASLNLTVNAFLYPLSNSVDRAVLTDEETKIIFSNLEDLVQIHRRFLRDLTAAVHKPRDPRDLVVGRSASVTQDTSQLGDMLKRFSFEVRREYPAYVNNFEQAMSAMHRLDRKSSAWRKALQSIYKEHSLRLDLVSYLIMPIQRAPRYALLIEEILKYLPDGHPHKMQLDIALLNVTEAVKIVNSAKRAAENATKIQALSEKLSGYDVLTSTSAEPRELIHEGPVIEKNIKKGSKYVYFILLNDVLLVVEQKRKNYKFREAFQFPLSVKPLSDTMTLRFAFEILDSKNLPRVFYTMSELETNRWLKLLQQSQEPKVD